MQQARECDAERLGVLRPTGLLEAGRFPSLDRLTGAGRPPHRRPGLAGVAGRRGTTAVRQREMLLDNPTPDDLARRHAAVVDRTVLHLQRLVDDLLDLARLDAGHLGVEPLPMPADRLLR